MGVGGKQRCWERTSNSLIMYRVCCFKGCRCVSSVENIPPTSERGRDEDGAERMATVKTWQS